jgi:hypothetical protein
MDNKVKMDRAGLRRKPAQISGKYFTMFDSAKRMNCAIAKSHLRIHREKMFRALLVRSANIRSMSESVLPSPRLPSARFPVPGWGKEFLDMPFKLFNPLRPMLLYI